MFYKSKFPNMLKPSKIGKLNLKNRIIKTAAIWGDMTGQGNIRLYEAISKGGVGLVMIPVEVLNPESIDPSQTGSSKRSRIPGYEKLVKIIHDNDCPVFLEMTMRGAWQVGPPGFPAPKPVSASSISESQIPKPTFFTNDRFAPDAHELTKDEINEIVKEITYVCTEAKDLGFDGVELNAARCHLFNSFISPFWNRRTDEYGCGTIENRTRIVADIIRSVKNTLGENFPVVIQMNAVEYAIPNGITVEEGKEIAFALEKSGADALEVRAYGYGEHYNRLHIPEQIFYPEPPKPLAKELDSTHKTIGVVIPLAGMIKNAVSIPIITVGKIRPAIGEAALRDGKADFIGMCRSLMADPNLPNKLAEGKTEDIAPCTTCIECFRMYGSPSDPNAQMKCRINADAGSEDEYGPGIAKERKKVVVVGGGPAGMEAARISALRGHQVILFEKESKLGGLLSLAGLIKGLGIEDIAGLSHYLQLQVKKSGVDIRTGKKAGLQEIKKLNPDVVILATGSENIMPDIEGIKGNRSVVNPKFLHSMSKTALKYFGINLVGWLTKLYMPIGKHVLIIGGSMHGCELAEFFAKRGRKVTIVDTDDQIGRGMIDLSKGRLFAWFRRKGVTMIPKVKYESIKGKTLNILIEDDQKQSIKADTIIPALPPVSNNYLYEQLINIVPEVYSIGDCKEPRLILNAIAEGSKVARSIG